MTLLQTSTSGSSVPCCGSRGRSCCCFECSRRKAALLRWQARARPLHSRHGRERYSACPPRCRSRVPCACSSHPRSRTPAPGDSFVRCCCFQRAACGRRRSAASHCCTNSRISAATTGSLRPSGDSPARFTGTTRWSGWRRASRGDSRSRPVTMSFCRAARWPPITRCSCAMPPRTTTVRRSSSPRWASSGVRSCAHASIPSWIRSGGARRSRACGSSGCRSRPRASPSSSAPPHQRARHRLRTRLLVEDEVVAEVAEEVADEISAEVVEDVENEVSAEVVEEMDDELSHRARRSHSVASDNSQRSANATGASAGRCPPCRQLRHYRRSSRCPPCRPRQLSPQRPQRRRRSQRRRRHP